LLKSCLISCLKNKKRPQTQVVCGKYFYYDQGQLIIVLIIKYISNGIAAQIRIIDILLISDVLIL
jgi:hypothetical protein